MRTVVLAVVLFSTLVLFGSWSAAGDWPMWRYDAARGAASPHALPATLHLQWVLQLPKPKPAWPADQYKLQFDQSYEPIVTGKLLVVPSMISDSVTAYDTETGTLRWRFYADGPVRFAPVAYKGNLYFVSDDGFLYCLRSADGQFRWKARGGPSDLRVLGNERLISAWPARGAPVVADGTVYFAASIWPFMGIFIHAVDAETGRIVWTNSGSGANFIVQQHGSPAFAGVAPQGYLAVADDKLLVSGGRTVPAVYNRQTGEFLYFQPGSRAFSKDAGGYAVTAGPDCFFNGGGMYRLSNGAFVEQVAADVVTSDRRVFGIEKGTLAVRHLSGSLPEPAHLQPQQIHFTDSSAAKLLDICIAAGLRLYGLADDDTVVALDIPQDSHEATVAWRGDVRGSVWTMLAGDDRLFVVTKEGWIFCFGGRETGAILPEFTLAESDLDDGLATLIPRAAKWRYLADGSDPGETWFKREFDDRRWPTARVDQEEDVEVKKINRPTPTDPPACDVTFYYRGVFQRPKNLMFDELRLNVTVDDGTLVYLNGKQVGQLNFQDGVPDRRAKTEPRRRKRASHVLSLDPNLMMNGRNVLALAVPHQTEYPDASFHLECLGELAAAEPPLLETGPARPNARSADEKILPATGARDGYGVVWGAGDGRLIDELLRDTNLKLIVVEPDARRVAELQARFDAERLLGTRVAFHVGSPANFRLPPYFASLMVCEDPQAAGLGRDAELAVNLFPSLRPHGGVACLQLDEEGQAALAKVVESLRGESVQRSGRFVLLRRPGGLPGAGQWTHQNGNAANTLVSDDQLVKLPLGLLWFGGPSNAKILPRHGHGPMPQVVGGRLFIEGPDTLRAVDIYTGRLLWERKLTELGAFYNNTDHQAGAGAIGGNYVTVADGIYVAYGRTGLRLNPATGQTIAEFVLPLRDDRELRADASSLRKPPFWGVLAVHDDLLIAGSSPIPPVSSRRWQPDATGSEARFGEASRALVVMDRRTGQVLWTRDADDSFRHNTIVAGTPSGKPGPLVFCLDRMTDEQMALLKRRGILMTDGRDTLYALDGQTGEVLWKYDAKVFGTWLGYSAKYDVLLQAGSRNDDRAPDEASRGMIAYRGTTGEVLWRDEVAYAGPCLLLDDQIITQSEAYALRTGKRVERMHPLTGEMTPWSWTRKHGCNTAIGCKHLLTFRSAAAGFLDLASDSGTGNLGGFRSSCTNNLVPAGGVLNAPDYTRTCVCSYQNQTSLALVHMPELEMWTFSTLKWDGKPVRRLGVNLGAPGDRRAADGTLWLDYPSVGGPSPDVPIHVRFPTSPSQPANAYFRLHASQIEGEQMNWIAASGVRGDMDIDITLAASTVAGTRPYKVRLYFCEIEDLKPGQRRFHVQLQGQEVVRSFDIVATAGAVRRACVKEFAGVIVGEKLTVSLRADQGSQFPPLLCGVEVLAENW